jgi:hypothetical protein
LIAFLTAEQRRSVIGYLETQDSDNPNAARLAIRSPDGTTSPAHVHQER